MKNKISLMILFAIVLTFATACSSIQLIGTDAYYLQINDDGEKYDDAGYERFAYEMTGIDEEGNEKVLEFTAGHNLKKEAFLKVYYKDSKGVVSYEEVQEDDLPDSALDFFGLN